MVRRITVLVGLMSLVATLGAGLGRWTANDAAPVSDSESDLGAARTIDELVSWSCHVAIATLVSVRTEDVPLVSPVDGTIRGHRTDQVYSFSPIRILKGEPGQLLSTVRSASEIHFEDEDGTPSIDRFGDLKLVEGRQYVLFLTMFSATTGSDLGFAGPIGVAEVDVATARLAFLTSSLEDTPGSEPPPPLLAQQLTVSDVEAAIREPKPPHDDNPPSNEGTSAAYANAVGALIEGLQKADDDSDVDALLKETGLEPGSIADGGVCRKVQGILSAHGHTRDLRCP